MKTNDRMQEKYCDEMRRDQINQVKKEISRDFFFAVTFVLLGVMAVSFVVFRATRLLCSLR